MQPGLIVGIVFAIVAALFAMQNIAPATVTAGLWSFQGALALVLLLSLGPGALVAGLARKRLQTANPERKMEQAGLRNAELRADLSQARSTAGHQRPSMTGTPLEEQPHAGLLRTRIAGGRENREEGTAP